MQETTVENLLRNPFKNPSMLEWIEMFPEGVTWTRGKKDRLQKRYNEIEKKQRAILEGILVKIHAVTDT